MHLCEEVMQVMQDTFSSAEIITKNHLKYTEQKARKLEELLILYI